MLRPTAPLNLRAISSRVAFHDGAHLDAQAEDVGNLVDEFTAVLATEGTDDAAHENTEEKGFTQQAELLFHAFGVDVEPVEAGNAVEPFVDESGKGYESLAEGLGNGNAFHLVVESLELVGCEVGKHKGDNVADDGCEEAPQDAVGSKIDYGADEGIVPVVPQVNVDGAGGLGQQHDNVDRQADGDDEGTHRCVVGDGGGCGPTHVEHLELESVEFDNAAQGRAQAAGEQGCDDGETDETDTDEQTALEGFAQLDADAYAEDGENNRHHDGGAETDNVTEYAFHVCKCCLFF